MTKQTPIYTKFEIIGSEPRYTLISNSSRPDQNGFWACLKPEGGIISYHQERLKILCTNSVDVAMRFIKPEMWVDYTRGTYEGRNQIADISLLPIDQHQLFRVSGNGYRLKNKNITMIYFEKPECKHNWRINGDDCEFIHCVDYTNVIAAFKCMECGKEKKTAIELPREPKGDD